VHAQACKSRGEEDQSPMTFKTIKPARLSDSIIHQIEELILNGVLKPGDRLPAERELAQELDVSRPSLREALLKLEARGLLKARPGGGTFVADIAAPTVTEPLVELLKDRPEATFQILELRHALEEMAAWYAALRATEADREIIRRRYEALIELYDTNDDPDLDAEADAEFHLAIADASHNVALIHVVRGLFSLLRNSITRSLQQLKQRNEDYAPLRDQHRAIYEAIMAGDPARAREAANVHLTYVEEFMRKGIAMQDREAVSQRRLRRLLD